MFRILLQSTIVFAVMLIPAFPSLAADTVTALPSKRSVALTGFTRASAVLPVVSEASGRVISVFADVGDAINARGELAVIDSTFIKLDLEANRIQQAKLETRIDYDAKEAARYRNLVDRGSAAQSKLDGLEQTLAANRHELAALKVSERVLEEKLERTHIPAPAGWRITAREIEPGQWVSAGQQVGEAADFSTLVVPYALTPEQYDILRRSQQNLTVKLTEAGLQVPAAIYNVNPGFDSETRKIQVELSLEGKLPEQRGGLRTELRIEMPEASGTVLLPPQAVTERYEVNWLTRADGAQVRVVVLGNHSGKDGTLLRITSPEIRPGDEFRIHGQGE